MPQLREARIGVRPTGHRAPTEGDMATKMQGCHLDREAPALTIIDSMVGMAAKTVRDRTLIAVLSSENLVTRYHGVLYLSKVIFI